MYYLTFCIFFLMYQILLLIKLEINVLNMKFKKDNNKQNDKVR